MESFYSDNNFYEQNFTRVLYMLNHKSDEKLISNVVHFLLPDLQRKKVFQIDVQITAVEKIGNFSNSKLFSVR